MKAVILAAGYGNRMRPLTDDCHKTMLTVGGRTIIARILDGLALNGITDIVVVTGYRAEELTTYLTASFPQHSFTFINNERYRETNNIYSLALAFDGMTIDSDIIIIESDLIYDPSVIERLLNSPYGNIALVDHYRTGMDGTVVTVENGIVTNVIPPHLQSSSFDFSDKYKTLNIYKFSREFCETSFKKLLVYYATAIDHNCYYELILGILIYMQKETIHAEIINNETWSEVDDPNDLHVAEFDFNVNRKEILEHAFGGYWNYNVTDFCFIRNMHFPNAAIVSELKNVLPELICNYGSRQSIIDKKMSWFLLCNESHVTALNGAAQVFPILSSLYGTMRALIPVPTFGEYISVFKNCDTYQDTGTFSMETVVEKAATCDLVVFVNPNNPTGTVCPTDAIYTFASTYPHKTIIVDESFIEFSSHPSIVAMLEDAPLDNVIVVKSLSKSLGVPGIRLGYTYSCNKAYNHHVKMSLPIWNMNSIAEFFLEVILKHRNSLNASFTQTINDREEFSRQLAAIPFVDRVFASGANFLLVRFVQDASFVNKLSTRLLTDKSVFVKDISSKFSDAYGYVRLAVRTAEENTRLVELIGECGMLES